MVERCWSLHNHCCCEFIQFYKEEINFKQNIMILIYRFFFPGIKVKKFPLFSVHKFSYKFRFLDDDGEKLFAIVHVSAKFSYGLIQHCNSDPVMGNTFFFIIFFYLTKISINYPTHFSKILSK